MTTRATICLIIVGAILVGEWKSLARASGKARTAYIVIVLYALYSSVGYITGHPLPNVNNLMTVWLQKPAAIIDNSLKARRPADAADPAASATHPLQEDHGGPAFGRLLSNKLQGQGGA